MIEVTGLYKRYGNHLAVKKAGFKIEDGEVVGFLGPNGAGKSTIMNILTGYISLTAGTVSIDGYDIVENPEEAKRRIGYLPEIPPLYTDMTVTEYLNFIYDLKKVKFPRKPHIAEICGLVKLDDVKDRLIKNLSKGYRQRVGIAEALVGNPDVLILDEPTVGLDPKQIIEIRTLIQKLGKNHTIILSSHILSEIQAVCDRIIVINKGKIVADGTQAELSEKLSADRTLDVSVQGPAEDVAKLLAGIPGVISVSEPQKAEKGVYTFTVEPDENADIRREMFTRLAERNWPIYALKSNALTLEQLFLRLTEENASDGADDEQIIEELENAYTGTETAESTEEEVTE